MTTFSPVAVGSSLSFVGTGGFPLAADIVDGARSDRSMVSSVTYCAVDAAGVPAEWVDATVATAAQPTLVYFLSAGDRTDLFGRVRLTTGTLAVVTGARVLVVACSPRGDHGYAAAVRNGMAAYKWLIGEGCDLARTVFRQDATGVCLAEGVLFGLRRQGLPLPAGGVWSG